MGNIIRIFFHQKTHDRLRDTLIDSKKSVEDFVFNEIQNICVKGREVIDSELFPMDLNMNGRIIPQKIKLPDLKEYQLDFDPNWKPQKFNNVEYVIVEITAGENITLLLKAFCAAVNYLKNMEAHKLKETKKSRIKQYKKDNKTSEQTASMEKGFDELITAKTTKFDNMDIILQDNILPEINRKLNEVVKLSIQKEYQEIKKQVN